MKKLLLFMVYFCVGLMVPHFSAVAAGATTLRVGVPNAPTNPVPISYESISTTQIDTKLSSLTAQFPTQYQYPANFTQGEADKAFIELAGLKQDLDTQIFNVMLADPAIKSVFFVTSDVNPIKARLSQQGTSIGLEISPMEVRTRIELHTIGGFFGGILCATPEGSVDLVQLKATGSYDIYTGNSSGVVLYINPNNINVHDVSCGGILGPIIGLLVNSFGTGVLENAIANIINGLVGIGNKQTLFSARKFLEGFLDSNLLTAANSGKLLSTMDEIIMKTNLNSGLQLDIEIDDGVNNMVSFVASQKGSSITNLEYTLHAVLVDFTVPANSVVEIYLQYPGGSTWSLAATMTHTGLVLGELDNRTRIMAVARSTLIPGLYSFRSIRTTNHVFNGGACPPGAYCNRQPL